MIIIFTLIAAFILVVIWLIALVYNENRKALKDENKIDEAALLECDRISRKDMDYELCEYPFYDCYKSSN